MPFCYFLMIFLCMCYVLHAPLTTDCLPFNCCFILFPTLLKHLLAHDWFIRTPLLYFFMHESLSVSLWQKFLIAILFSSELRNTKFLKNNVIDLAIYGKHM